MKSKSITNKTKDTEFNSAETGISEVDHECGRMDYLGVDMAFIYIRSKLMFAMSEVARKLYPQWPRTTLNDRVKQMKVQWHTCTPREIEKVLSVKGIAKLGVHCTLISKEDLDMFCSVYGVGSSVGSRSKPTSVTCKKYVREKRGKQISAPAGSGVKRNKTTDKSLIVHSKIKKRSLLRSNYTKQSQSNANGNKSKTRVIVKDIKLDNGTALERHVVNEVNKATGKHVHVVKPARCGSASKQLNNIQTKAVGRPKKRTFPAVNLKSEPQRECHEYLPTKRHRKMRETNSPDSDCVSYDSGISSLKLDAPRKPGRKKIGDFKPERPVTPKSQNHLKIKQVKRKYITMKAKKAKQTGKEIVFGRKRNDESVKRGRKSKKGEEIKNGKIGKYSCPNAITKDLIMKMDLKHMNDKDLINSFSPLSSPLSKPSEDQPYLVKLMPVKPVWRVNSSFKFISNFQLPPSLIVQDGQLSPACSMICSHRKKPPAAHPIWKWKVGEPVVSNKTVISYRIKKVKCT